MIGGILLATACSSSAARTSEGTVPGGATELVSDAGPSGAKPAPDAAGEDAAMAVDASDAAPDAGGASDAAPDASDAGACLGDEPGPTPTCPADGPCAELCARVVTHYRSGVARAAAACIAKACTGALDVVPCVDAASARACPAEDALPYCQAIVGRCDPNADDPEQPSGISTPGCVGIATALAPAGRATFQTCIESSIEAGTCPSDVVACADSIRQ